MQTLNKVDNDRPVPDADGLDSHGSLWIEPINALTVSEDAELLFLPTAPIPNRRGRAFQLVYPSNPPTSCRRCYG